MDDLQTSDEVTFIPELIEPVCYDAIESIIKDKLYNEILAQSWIDEICAKVTKNLIETNKPFKYMGKFYFFLFSNLKFFFHFSFVHNNAKKWSWLTSRTFLLLGCCK